jgi:hypothetical protein
MRTAVEKIKNVTVDTPASSFSVYLSSFLLPRSVLYLAGKEKSALSARRAKRCFSPVLQLQDTGKYECCIFNFRHQQPKNFKTHFGRQNRLK